MIKKISLFIMILILSNQNLMASTCIDFLNSNNKNARASRSLPVPIKPYQLTRTNNYLAGEGLTGQLIKAQVLHSAFFKQIIETTSKEPWSDKIKFKFNTPDKISILSKAQNDSLAHLIYDVMKSEFQNQGESIKVLSDPRTSKITFFSADQAEVIDKIGEALIVTGSENKFRDFSKESRELKDAPWETGSFVIGGLIGVFTGIVWLVAPENLIYNSTWQIWAGLSTALVGSSSLSITNRVKKAPQKMLQNLLTSHETIEGTYTVEPGFDYLPGELATQLLEIKRKVYELKENSEQPTTRNLLIFGSKSVQLHRELNLTFHTDFMRWMSIYERNKDLIKKRIEDIRNRKLRTYDDKREVLNFLEKMLQEASEATVLTSEISYEIIKLIDQDLTLLTSSNINLDNSFVERDFNRRKDFLRLAKITHSQFLQSLEPIHATISNLMNSIATLGLAESAAMAMDLGLASKELDQNSALDSILSGLSEMDEYLRKLGSLDHIPEAEVLQ